MKRGGSCKNDQGHEYELGMLDERVSVWSNACTNNVDCYQAHLPLGCVQEDLVGVPIERRWPRIDAF